MIRSALLKYSAYVLGYLSISGYYLAYYYKKGYFDYFNIPNIYISGVDFIDIIKMISAIIVFFSSGLYIILTHRPRDKEQPQTWLIRINQIAMPITIILLFMSLIDTRIIKIMLLIIIVIILLYNFVFPLIIHSQVKGYDNKIDSFFKSDERMGFMETLVHKIEHQAFSLLIIIASLTLLLGYFVNFLGYQEAKNEEYFDVAEVDGIKYVTFNISEEKIVTAALKDKVLSRKFTLQSKGNLKISREKIKDLKVSK